METDKDLEIDAEFVTYEAVRNAVIKSIRMALIDTNAKYDKSFELDEDSLKIKENNNGK